MLLHGVITYFIIWKKIKKPQLKNMFLLNNWKKFTSGCKIQLDQTLGMWLDGYTVIEAIWITSWKWKKRGKKEKQSEN